MNASALQVELPAASTLTVRGEQGTVALIEEMAAEWRRLCEEGPCNQPFYRPEWMVAVVRSFAPAQRLFLLTLRRESRLRAVLPLLWEQNHRFGIPQGRLRSATNLDHSCRFDVVHGANIKQSSIAAAVWEYLKRKPGWDSIELSNVPEGAVLERMLRLAQRDAYRTARLEFVRSPRLNLEAAKTDGPFWQFAQSSKLRSNLRNRWRKLQQKGAVTLRRAEEADAALLQQFYRLEQCGWKGRDGTAIACSPQTRQFYDAIAASAGRFGYFTLHFLEVSGRAIAARFGFTLGGCYFPLKLAYDEAYSEFGPGHLLVGLVLQDVRRRGITQCDWLGHHEAWKAQWTSNTLPHNFCYIFRNTPAGHMRYWERMARHRGLSLARQLGRPAIAALRSWKARLTTNHSGNNSVE